MPTYSDSDLQMPDYQMQDLLTIRSNSMFISVIPPIDKSKLTQTTNTLVKTKSMRGDSILNHKYHMLSRLGHGS